MKILLSVFVPFLACAAMAAEPVWLEGRETERNLFVGFRTRFDGAKADDAETLLSRVSVETTRKNLILTYQTKVTDGALLLTAKGNLPGLSIIIR